MQVQNDFSYKNGCSQFQKYSNVGINTKHTAGDFWYDCTGYKSPAQNENNISSPTPRMNRVMSILFDTAQMPLGTFVAKVEVSYYVMFK